MNRIQTLIVLVTFLVFYFLTLLYLYILVKKKGPTTFIKLMYAVHVIIGMVACYSFLFYTTFASYDRYGVRYKFHQDVVFFSNDGQKYRKYGEYVGSMEFVNMADQQDKHRDKESFVTKEGYIVFIDADKVTETEEIGVYIDENGNEVYEATFVSWGWTGYMHRP